MPNTLMAQQKPLDLTLGAIQQVSMVSADNRNPVIAYSQDGSRLFVCWDGLINMNRRILMRERVGNEWLQPIIVDDNPAGVNECPSIAIDDTGAPHITWISTVKGQRVPLYARRISRFPNMWHYQNITVPKDSTVSGNCDYLNLQLDDEQKPWVVWQYGYGSVYSVACSHLNEAGDFTSAELTPGATSHNLDPKIFFLPKPTVYWYVSQSDQFYLVGAKFNKAIGDWQISQPDNLDNIAADSLPELFRTGTGPFAAIWYDQANASPGGDTSEHVFLGVQSPDTKGRGEVIADQKGSDYHSVAGTSRGGNLLTAWVSETYADGAQVYLGIGTSPETIKPIQLSESQTSVNSNPNAAITDTEASIAWEIDNGAGYSRIAIRTLRF